MNKIWGVDLKPSLLACEIPEARKFRAKIEKIQGVFKKTLFFEIATQGAP